MSWTADPLAARRAERERMLGRARSYVSQLRRRIPLEAAAVGGSVARGDFNVWSDVDVVLVSDALPEPGPQRAALLGSCAGPGVEPHGYTSAEFRHALARGDRLARETADSGVALLGELPR
jgi:hypothetical protein